MSEVKWWRIDIGDETVVIEGETPEAAWNSYIECLGENADIREAEQDDMLNYGPGSGNGWYQD